jgi:hypothetical protein
MKKFYLSVLSVLVLASSGLTQTKLSSEFHSFRLNDEHYFIISEDAEQGPAGYGETWDFSGLKKKGEMTSHMLPAYNVKKADRAPEANLVLEEYDTHFFFKANKNTMKQYATALGNGTFIRYNEPFVKLRYPFEYGESYEGDYSGKLITSKGKARKFNGNYSVEVDGYGSLILPGDIRLNDVLRLKTVKRKKYENTNYTSVTISYKWYCKEVNYPLLTVIRSGTEEKTKPTKVAYYGDAASINQKEESQKKTADKSLDQMNVNIYPNPFSQNFTIDYAVKERSDVRVTLFDNSGKKVKETLFEDQAPGSYSRMIKAGDKHLSGGMYYINLQIGDQVIRKNLLKVK